MKTLKRISGRIADKIVLPPKQAEQLAAIKFPCC